MFWRKVAGAVAVGLLVAIGPLVADTSAASAPVTLGGAGTFAVLGATTVTSAGVSTVIGDLGVSPGTAVTGFPPGRVTGGALHAGDAVATQAHADLATAYADAAGRRPATPITGDLGGQTLTAGVYAVGAALTLGAGGTLTLDAQGDPNAVFILQAGSTLGTGANSEVNLIRGAQSCNVFWQVGSSATLGASSTLRGTIVASTSISMGDGVTVDGRALARDGAVTLINDTITASRCSGSLSNTAPPITPFSLKLTGLTQTVYTAIGAWNVTDTTATNAGYSITVAASTPTVNGSAAAAGTGASIRLTPATATAAPGNLAGTGPIAASTQTLSTAPTTIENAATGTGQGQWDFAADAGPATTGSLAIVIPGDAGPGAYNTTLTFTTAPNAG